MKLVGTYRNIPVYSSPDCPPDTVYLMNDNFTIKHPTRKDGKPDMRFGINKMEMIFKRQYGL
jgi:hypothetical protein